MDRRILVVDDSELICRQMSQLLARADRQIKVAHDGTEALEWLVEGNFSLVLTDLRLPGFDGLELIREMRQRNLPVTVVVLTGFASVNSAVEAMKLGAYDYLIKPIDPVRLGMLVDHALKDRELRDQVESLRQGMQQKYGFHNLLGRCQGMKELFATISRVASSRCNVLITGETGTGKELVAQALHVADATRRGPLITVNCAALPEPLLESELFGHEKGAFTGAERQKKGRFELAEGGTLFLDEIGEMPMAMQAKLLRVLQDGQFERVGGTEPVRVDTRVIAASHVDPVRAVEEGRFRRDLFYRLNVVSVPLPALRDRMPCDLPLLVDHFLKRLVDRGLASKTFSKEAIDQLTHYSWPGNVRELENLVEQLVVTTPGPLIDVLDLPEHVRAQGEGVQRTTSNDAIAVLDDDLCCFELNVDRPLPQIVDDLTARAERAYLQRVLVKYRGRIDASAKHCGLSRRSISEKLRRYKIDKADFKVHYARLRRVALGEP